MKPAKPAQRTKPVKAEKSVKAPKPVKAQKPAKAPKPEKKHAIYTMSFAKVYPLYIQKVERKGREKKELDEVIRWLTGYTQRALEKQIAQDANFETFFAEAPELHPNAVKITGTICGVRIAEIEDPLMLKVRYLDKLVDELAKGRPMEKILRQ